MDINRSAQILRKELAKEGIEIKHTKLLDMLSKASGYKDYDSSKSMGDLLQEKIDMIRSWDKEDYANSETI